MSLCCADFCCLGVDTTRKCGAVRSVSVCDLATTVRHPAPEQDEHEADSGAEAEVLVENPDAEKHRDGRVDVRDDGGLRRSGVRNHIYKEYEAERGADDAE